MSKLADYLFYSEPGITLYCGDCRDVLPLLAPPDLLLTDPPYPGFDKGWEIPDVAAILGGIQARVSCVFWPALLISPIADVIAEHIWHKPNGRSSQHYERILVAGDAPRISRVYRVAAILPDYVQYRQEAVAHPTQKPIKLVAAMIRAYAHGPLLDPFSGSGTTLEAAKIEGKPAIGIEIEPKYCEIAVKRLRQEVLAL